jgi:hypothetical protein
VTPEHALTEHSSWILIHQRSLPFLAPLRHARPACKCPFTACRNRTCCRRANIYANDPTRTSSFGHTGEAQAAKIALAPGNIGWVVA